MSKLEATTIQEVIEKLCRRLGIPPDVVYRVYCSNEDIPKDLENKLLQLENELVEELEVENVDEVMEVFCAGAGKTAVVEEAEEEAETQKRVTEEKLVEVVAEQVIRIPVYVHGEQRFLNIILTGKRPRIETDIEGVCSEPSDIVLGQVSIYLKCGDAWISLVHRLSPEAVQQIARLIKKS